MRTTCDSHEIMEQRLAELQAENSLLRQNLAAKEASCEALTHCVHDIKNILIEIGEAARLSYGRQPEGKRYDDALVERIQQLYGCAVEAGRIRRETAL